MPAPLTIDAYLASLPEGVRPVAEAACAVVDAVLPAGSGTVRRRRVTWSLGPEPGELPVCHLRVRGDHVVLGFVLGHLIADGSGRLVPGPHASAEVQLRAPADVDAPLFTDWLYQALGLEDALAA